MQMQTQKKTHATDGTQDKKYVQKRKKKHTITGENACRYYKTIVMIPSTLYMNTPFATNTTRTKKKCGATIACKQKTRQAHARK